MTEKEQVKITFDEEAGIISRLDAIAESEGTSRAALIRRAIRRLVFSSPIIPTFGNEPEVKTPAAEAAA